MVASLLAPCLDKHMRKLSGWILALLPLGITIYLYQQSSMIASTGYSSLTLPWFPSLNIMLSFYLDGLSLLFSLLISFIGILIVIYSHTYLEDHPLRGRFYAFLFMFMGSMLGLVLADNVITLFVFWELTSIASYFLIGFDHKKDESRQAALQALLVTGVGGLAMLAGLVLLSFVGHSMELSTLLNQGDLIRKHSSYFLILILVLAGAFTKSAQFPFHFWLPNAMVAPTPVSAYLHSSTIVMAGIYLLARLSPILAHTVTWSVIVTTTGVTTMVVGAYMCLGQRTVKRLLAYSTVSSLGILTMLLGLGTKLALKAAMIYLVGHAFYKASLFLVAGAIDHSTGEKDVNRLSGLWTKMPITALASCFAALSMAGIPPLFGFIAKENILEATWTAPYAAPILTAAMMMTMMLFVAVVIIVGIKPFIGKIISTPKIPHEAPVSLWMGPVLLALLGLVSGIFPGHLGQRFIAPALTAITREPAEFKLALWHGLTPMLVLGIIVLTGGPFIYALRKKFGIILSYLYSSFQWWPEQTYKHILSGTINFSQRLTRFIQSGILRYYLLTIIGVTAGLISITLFLKFKIIVPDGFHPSFSLIECGLSIIMLAATISTVRSRTRLAAVASMGVLGMSMVLVFAFYSAPDLSMTTIAVEALTVILLVFVFYHMPAFDQKCPRPKRRLELVISVFAGSIMTLLVYCSLQVQHSSSIAEYFKHHSLSLAHGRNIVNVILVDFRALDTLGEITVLAAAGLGVYALIKMKPKRNIDS